MRTMRSGGPSTHWPSSSQVWNGIPGIVPDRPGCSYRRAPA
jgi:hypothetical protein